MRWAARRNDFPHSSHRYGFSPVCVLQTESSNAFRNFRSRYLILLFTPQLRGLVVGNDIPPHSIRNWFLSLQKNAISTPELPPTIDKFKLTFFKNRFKNASQMLTGFLFGEPNIIRPGPVFFFLVTADWNKNAIWYSFLFVHTFWRFVDPHWFQCPVKSQSWVSF
jgi:hypothetical protein